MLVLHAWIVAQLHCCYSHVTFQHFAPRPLGPPSLQVRVPKEETALVSDLRYGWKKLRKLATDMSDNLARLQVGTWGQVCEA